VRLEDLRPAAGSKKRPKRVGRGDGSGHGNQSGRGGKGQTARSGFRMVPGFEGGQTPLWKSLPKRGFKNPRRKEYTIVNLKTLNAKYEDGSEVTPQNLKEKKIIKDMKAGVKILGQGELDKKLTVKAHRFSQEAKLKIEQAGGTAISLEQRRI